MAGFHNQTLYTMNDNPWCIRCLEAEIIFGDKIFNEGGFMCHAKAIPTKEEGCDGYIPIPGRKLQERKIMVGYMLGQRPLIP